MPYFRVMRLSVFLSFLFIAGLVRAQDKPRLVVGIVVDQMRQDYLSRFADRFCDSGFKRLQNEGFSYDNGHYNYIPTYTGPGHASIYTGTTPAYHGIVANDWYDRLKGDFTYCAEDSTAKGVGSAKTKGMSPKNLLTTTVTDELALATQFRSKIVGLSIKDRGAILPAGHTANGAFWYDNKSGKMVSSDWYAKELPAWITAFNQRGLPLQYLDNTWVTLFPLTTYTASAPDNNPYENSLKKGADPVFPYNLKELQSEWGYQLLTYTPYSNTFLTQAAYAAIEGEQMGQDEVTDFLCLSYSAPDYIGHFFGPQAVELEDTYLRLDREIAALLHYLDTKVGKGNYTVFLTADHGGNEVVSLLQDHRISAGLLQTDAMIQGVKTGLFQAFGDSLLLSLTNEQLYLDRDRVSSLKLNYEEVCKKAAELVMHYPGIQAAGTYQDLIPLGHDPMYAMLLRGYHPQRSGDVLLLTSPGWMEYRSKGTSHGSGYSYDTRVPFLFMGAGVRHGRSSRKVAITDIAPSISLILGISFPNGTTGTPLTEMLGY